MDQFFESHNLRKLTKELDNLNRPISKEIESISNDLWKEHQAKKGSLVTSTKHLKKKVDQLSTVSPRK